MEDCVNSQGVNIIELENSFINLNMVNIKLKLRSNMTRRDFLGGANYFWQGTPMYRLFEKYHDDEGYTSDEAVEAAGKTAGHLLKRVLIRDSVRVYRLEDAGMANGYRWIEDVEERNARRAKELES